MRIDIVTLFPQMFVGPLDESIVQRARMAGHVDLRIHQLRDYATGKHRTVDDYAFGGGTGMVLKPEPIFAAVETIVGEAKARVVLLTPQGRVLDQSLAAELASSDRLVLICGHYEGVDERVREHLVTDEISIGDYVLTGGELAAIVVVDAVVRLRPGVLPADAPINDSIATGLLEHPQFTRPAEFRGWRVPPVLLSGKHEAIELWRRRESLARTLSRRPDLLASAPLTADDLSLLAEIAISRREAAPQTSVEPVGLASPRGHQREEGRSEHERQIPAHGSIDRFIKALPGRWIALEVTAADRRGLPRSGRLIAQSWRPGPVVRAAAAFRATNPEATGYVFFAGERDASGR
ncbi:MAG: tRNA (guanosine(37)-N1)-methyltransferase TrmD [Chloroflexi bacterium]|nr:tRNA (guanosine(37)-N1)-methyltransferase TrmD [Chloroflexota bacterium]